MFSSIFSFEVRRLLRAPSTYIYFLVLVSVTFLLALLSAGVFPEAKFSFGGEKIYANSPLVIDAFFSAINQYVGLIILVAIVGNAVLKDFKFNTYSMIFTTPITRFQYLAGRFSSSMFITLLILTGPAFGMMLGYAMPFVNPDRIGAFMLLPYIQTYWQTIIPNALICGSIFFSVSLISRDIFVIWLSLIIFFVANGVANSIFSSLDQRTLSALADPMAGFAKRTITKYWSTYEKNTRTISLSGLFLYNRLLWMAIASGIWALGYSYFSFTSGVRRISFGKTKMAESSKINFVPIFFRKDSLPLVHPVHTTAAMLRNLWGLSVNECKTLLRNVYFRIILLFGMLFLFLISTQIGKIYETTTYPVTYVVIESLSGTFSLFIVILTILFGGESVWREREFRMSNIVDALPVPNWVFYISKLTGLFFMQIILVSIVLVCGILVQLSKGYTHIEFGLYLRYIYGYGLIDFWLLAILSVFVQTIVRNKFIGYFIVALFYIWNSAFASIVLKHNFLIFSSDPGVIYSDMNGFGHLTFGFVIYKLYWAALCMAIAAATSLLWARGTEKSMKMRLRDAMNPENRKSWVVVVVSLIVFAGMGSYVYYNTHVLNDYTTSEQQLKEQIAYEKKYSKYKTMPQPKISDVRLQVDLYPSTRGLHAAGTYVLQNKTNIAIDSIHVVVPESVKINSMSITNQSVLRYNDSTVAYRIYQLSQPLLPGSTVTLSFDVSVITKGFQHNFSGLSTPLYNGTFVNNQSFLPSIGYNPEYEVTDNSDRKKHGMPYRPTSNSINDSVGKLRNLFVHDADFINLEATVSTEPDQIALAPGYLQREWTEKGRKYYHYKMDSKILNFYSFLSAKYKVKKEKWNDVNLEIYYHPGHEYNLDRMMNGIKKSLAYYEKVFSPYQHKQVRILEFPRYATFAQSFPNTIPFSEGIGFIANVAGGDKENVDYPFYVTAHEVAHQWFAHQVIGANVEGSNLLSESLAQYGSIMVLEREYGEDKLRKFLRIEMDNYLSSRSSESEKEKPWAYADAGQGYILYQKGGILMHAFNKYLGEDSMNHAVKRFIDKYAFQGPPYPTTLQLVESIRMSTPDSLQYFITDAFEKITIYDNKLTDVKVTGSGTHQMLEVTVDANKYYADSTGKETIATGSNYVEIGIYKDRKKMITNQMYLLKPGINKLSIPVTQRPYKVVLDPRMLLIDKKTEDNEKRLNKDEVKESKADSRNT